jgi:hypothetical protein
MSPPGTTELPAEPKLFEWLQQFRNQMTATRAIG